MVQPVSTEEEFNAALQARTCVFFWAPWHQPSKPGGQMDQVFAQLAELNSGAKGLAFLKVEAEAAPDLSERFAITVVPTFVLLKDGQAAGRVEGADAPAVTKRVQEFVAGEPAAATHAAAAGGDKRGGPDVSALSARLKRLTSAAPVMLFMKGNPQEPRCKFSRRVVELLRASDVEFGSFDILGDEDVRQGLKTFSNWPTYPQVYVEGKLVGGVDIVAEMASEGDLKEQLGLPAGGSDGAASEGMEGMEAAMPATVEERCKALVSSAPVVLFMKGEPDAPRCGFSRQAVALLRGEGVSFESFDILGDEEVRQGLKKLSDWPTYPQVYVNGELVGGLDIIKEMAENGELAEALKA